MIANISPEELPAALASSAELGFDQQVTRRGVAVRLRGLTASAIYNGAIGIVQACADEEEERQRCAGGRQPVRLQRGGKVLNARPENLEVLRAPLSAQFVEMFRRDLATGDVPMPIRREYFPQMAESRDEEHACSIDVACVRCASRAAPLYLVLQELAGPRRLGVECTDCAALIAAEQGVPAVAARITSFNDLRYRGVFSAISALMGRPTSFFGAPAVHPPGLPGPLRPGISESFYDY